MLADISWMKKILGNLPIINAVPSRNTDASPVLFAILPVIQHTLFSLT